jgi:hypothetical protein
MNDLAHVCSSCRTMTIFGQEAPFPRRCACCDHVIRAAAYAGPFIARPVLDEEDELDDRFTLELGPLAMSTAPF